MRMTYWMAGLLWSLTWFVGVRGACSEIRPGARPFESPTELGEEPPPVSVSVPVSSTTTTVWTPLRFDETGRLAPPRRFPRIRIDSWAGYLPERPDIALGAGLVLGDYETWRTTFQVGTGVVGFGLARKVLPLVSVGAAALWDVRESRFTPSAFVSIASF